MRLSKLFVIPLLVDGRGCVDIMCGEDGVDDGDMQVNDLDRVTTGGF